MASFPIPFEAAAVAAAIGWPLAAGLAVVLWSKRRAAVRRRRLAELDQGLTTMFHAVQARPAPERLALVVDALEEGEAMKPAPEPASDAPAPKSPLTA